MRTSRVTFLIAHRSAICLHRWEINSAQSNQVGIRNVAFSQNLTLPQSFTASPHALLRHFITQLLRHFDGETRLRDFFESNIAISETALGFDRSDNIADALPRGNAGVIKSSLHDAVRVRRGLLVHLYHAGDQIESPFSRLEHGALAELQSPANTLDFIGPSFDRAIHRR